MKIEMVHAMSPMLPAVITAAAFSSAFLIDEKTGISLGYFAAILWLVWWVARKWQRLIDEVKEIDRKVSNLRCIRGGECEFNKERESDL